ncbi:hypothetical protein AQUCO_02800088v1 [Aquilegia coerulea]|uniref:Uncharacterized protein n=1 Tax=Aquilegia coerulea TaxID=218851 RepID=A0A2G5D3V5_AQUCA|nr:hypothetical protein AQUCO_02800088v1 [Aquilegia coerulea]
MCDSDYDICLNDTVTSSLSVSSLQEDSPSDEKMLSCMLFSALQTSPSSASMVVANLTKENDPSFHNFLPMREDEEEHDDDDAVDVDSRDDDDDVDSRDDDDGCDQSKKAEAGACSSSATIIETVWEWLNDKDVGTIKIQGETGMGKTWIARHLIDRARNLKLFDLIIFLNFDGSNNKKIRAVKMDVQNQWSRHELEKEGYGGNQIQWQSISESLAEERYLLILDGFKNFKTNILEVVGIPHPKAQTSIGSKVLVTGKKSDIEDLAADKVLELGKLPEDKAWLLFQDICGFKVDSLPDIREFAQPLLEICNGVPFEIAILAGTLRTDIGELSSSSSSATDMVLANLRKAYDLVLKGPILSRVEFICEMLSSKDVKDCFLYCCTIPLYQRYSVKRLIAAWMISGFLDGFNCLEKAYEKGRRILKELIDRHLLFSIPKYNDDDTHVSVQTPLIDEVNDYVEMRELPTVFCDKMHLNFLMNTESDWGSLKVSLINGNLQSKFTDYQGHNDGLLLHGNKGCIPEELPGAFFDQIQHLHDLSLLHCGIRSLPKSLSKLANLKILAVRGCASLENVNQIRRLWKLSFLSLAGASSLKKIRDDFFRNMSSLIYLDLSGTQLKKLPSSFSTLRQLSILILRGCSQLEKLPSMEKMDELTVLILAGARSLKKYPQTCNSLKFLDLSETLIHRLPSVINLKYSLSCLLLRGCSRIERVPHPDQFHELHFLDLSGASAFKTFQREAASNSRNDSSFQKIDLSETNIAKVPSLSRCSELRELLLRNCSKLVTIPSLGTKLEVLDLSGSISLNSFQDESLGDDLLNLDLSRTRIEKLPFFSVDAKLIQLLLRECEYLEEIPVLELQNLEVLDLSGSIKFKKFNNASFDKFSRLHTLSLSATKIVELPRLSECCHLRNILLKGCLKLEKLPPLKQLVKLEVLDLSGAICFKQFQDESLGIKKEFRELNLSGTQVVKLPIISECYNLSRLILRDCPNFVMLSHLEALTRLQVLDLSGAASFTTFHDQSLGEKYELQVLDLSGTQVGELPSLSGCTSLSQLLLRDCAKIKTLPSLEELTKLEVLDLSCAASFTAFHDISLGQKYDLQKLDLSDTQVAELPFLSGCINLSQLLLRGCQNLRELPHLEELAKLKVLDLSGASNFMAFQDQSFGKKYDLQVLNLSKTQVSELPLLSGCLNITELLLRDCAKLKTLTPLEELTKLKVLDLSGATLFVNFQDQSLGKKYDLHSIDLSKTQVVELPSLSGCTNLIELILRDCPKFKQLPHLEELERIEVLDLSGDSSFTALQNECLPNNCALQTLDLSGTQVQEFSFLSRCKKLSQISLRGCSNLETLSLAGILNLQELDLSGTLIEKLSTSPSNHHNLHKLLLKGCTKFSMLPDSEVLKNLEVLDLSCTNIREIPAKISEWSCLRFLAILDRKYFWGFDWKNAIEVTKKLHLDPCETEQFSRPCIHITVRNTEIFHFIEKNSELWENCFCKFHFCLCTIEEWGKEKDIYLQGKGYVFKDIYYQASHIHQLTEEPDKFFKICGFQSFPTGIEQKNGFIKSLSDLGAKNVNVMKECWIESCDSMESAFYGEEPEENAALGRCLQNLWVSKLSELKSLFSGRVESESFVCLKHLYIECCPSLVIVFSSYIDLKNLKTLKIKFCDKLEHIFGEVTSREKTLPKLSTLNLLKLPKLRSVCGGVLSSLKNLRVQGCPNLQKLPISKNSTQMKAPIWTRVLQNYSPTGPHNRSIIPDFCLFLLNLLLTCK